MPDGRKGLLPLLLSPALPGPHLGVCQQVCVCARGSTFEIVRRKVSKTPFGSFAKALHWLVPGRGKGGEGAVPFFSSLEFGLAAQKQPGILESCRVLLKLLMNVLFVCRPVAGKFSIVSKLAAPVST